MEANHIPALVESVVHSSFPDIKLFEPTKTVTQCLHDHPDWPPKKAARHLFPRQNPLARLYTRIVVKRDIVKGRHWTAEELEAAYQRGRFSRRPSDLFLRIYADILLTIQRYSLAGNVSPALLGTSGTIPLSIISTIPDIMEHYRQCIALAQDEVFLVTNYWQVSDSVTAVERGLRDLDAAIAKRSGKPVVVKIIWDRGDIKQLYRNHIVVSDKGSIALGVPPRAEVPNLQIEVLNFHRPILGTFHQKAMVVDRRMALLNSNNIQDRPNLEMMVHLEGAIVDSLYDLLLISWNEKFEVRPPGLALGARGPPAPNGFADDNPYLYHIDIARAARAARRLLALQTKKTREEELQPRRSQEDPYGVLPWWRETMHSNENPGGANTATGSSGRKSDTFANLVSQLLDKRTEAERGSGSGGPSRDGSRPASGHSIPLQSILASFRGKTSEGDREAESGTGGAAPATATGLHHRSRSGIASTTAQSADDKTLNDASRTDGHELETVLSAEYARGPGVKFEPGTNDGENRNAEVTGDPGEKNTAGEKNNAGEKSNVGEKGGVVEDVTDHAHADTNEKGTPDSTTSTTGATDTLDDAAKAEKRRSRLRALSKALNAGAKTKVDAAIDDEGLIDDFKPHMLHRRHEPFPIAMVNRPPHGTPGHQDVRVPQNAAWLAGFRYAEKKVFIQTPTLNAAPIVRAVTEACISGGLHGTGIKVILFLDLGFNDKGESIPFQGGTNEQVVVRLYDKLRPLGKAENLEVYWYTGKDQVKPMNAIHKSRNCHIKFMAIDDQCAIVGNGNQDTQSWFHSQESNILIDDPQIVADWMEQLCANQSTATFGRVDNDGIWRDPVTREALQPPEKIGCFTALFSMI